MIVRPNDTLVLALDILPDERKDMDRLKKEIRGVAEELEELFGNNIKVIPLIGIKDSFIVRSDET